MSQPRFRFQMDAASSSTWDDLDEAEWVEVSGGDLEAPIMISCGLTTDGTFVVKGMIIGGGFERTEITANTLRKIPVASILQQLWSDFSPDQPPPDGDLDELTTWALMQHFSIGQERLPNASRSAARLPGDDEFERFAREYLKQRTKQHYGAMARTIKALHIERSTGYRRLHVCKERGLIPGDP